MLCPRWHRYSTTTTTTTTTTITITTTTTTTITLNFSSPNRHQVGKPNMSKVWGLFTDLDFQAITERYGGKVTGSGIRNQLYHEAMKKSGLTGAGNNRRAPDYFIAAAEAAFPYGKKGFETSKNMPAEHGRAYEREDAPSSEEVDELIVTMTAACQVQPRRGGVGWVEGQTNGCWQLTLSSGTPKHSLASLAAHQPALLLAHFHHTGGRINRVVVQRFWLL